MSAEEKIDDYISKYCAKHKISKEEAVKHQIVKNYSDYMHCKEKVTERKEE